MATSRNKAADQGKNGEDKDKAPEVEAQNRETGEITTKPEDKVADDERVVTDTDRLAGTVLATGRNNTTVTPVDMTNLDSPPSAKGPGPDEIPAPAEDSGDLATANLSSEARRPGKRVGVGERDEKMIAALLREREGLAARGEHDRIAQVDEQLQHYGHDPKSDARTRLPEGRSSSPSGQQTA